MLFILSLQQSTQNDCVTRFNDEKTKPAYGSKSDAYRIFENMLDSGHPPGDWETLLAEANKSGIKPPAKTL